MYVLMKAYFHITKEIKYWLRLINVETKEIRLEVIENREEGTLKSIVEKDVKVGNIIISDA